MEFKEEVKKSRIEHGMSQRDMAKKLGVSQFQVFNTESGRPGAVEGMSLIVFAKMCFLFRYNKTKIYTFLKNMVENERRNSR